MIKSIVCVDNKFGIGKRNGLLFHLKKDMSFFRETTRGHTVAMGENTLLSFPGSKPLKNRVNIVLSQDVTHEYEGCVNVHTFDDFLSEIAKAEKDDTVYIIGGASVYRQMNPYIDEALVTKVDADGGAEVFFPNLDEDPGFRLANISEPEEDEGFIIRFTTYAHPGKKGILK